MFYLSRILTVPQDAHLETIDFTADDIDTRVFNGMLDEEECYGVVDTDDDTETFVSFGELIQIVDDLDIKIEGVHVLKNSRAGMKFIPYQDPRYCTKLQAKTKSLLGVDVRVYKNEITAIVTDYDVVKDGTRIRLSDFGSKIADAFYCDWVSRGKNSKKLILVLDDKIEVYGDHSNLLLREVHWDISECSGGRFVDHLADAFNTYNLDRTLVIDKYKRV